MGHEEIRAGLQGRQELAVTKDNTAKALASGGLEVFATPAMIGMMESAALKSVAPYLAEDESTVGTKIEVSHLSATPVGMKVWCESRLVEADGRRLVFQVTAYDAAGKIGEGTHERFIVRDTRFMEKAEGKLHAAQDA